MLYLLNRLLIVVVLIYTKLFVSDSLKCPENKYTCSDGTKIVAFCVRKKSSQEDLCDKGPLEQIFEYPRTCLPTNCPVRIRNHCKDKDSMNENPCKNGGECKNFPGSYYCKCKPGYYGRDCSLQGKHYDGELYFIYDPLIGLHFKNGGETQQFRVSKALIFLTKLENDMTIVFTSSCTEKKIKPSDIMKIGKNENTKKKCEVELFEKFKLETVKNYGFCDYLPSTGISGYVRLYYEIPLDNTDEPPGSVIMSYNSRTQIDMPGFKVSKLTVALYIGEREEFRESFSQTTILQTETGSECSSPVILLVSGMRCVKPVLRQRNDKISVKSVFETTFKFGTRIVCTYLSISYNWEVFDYKQKNFKPDESKIKIRSKNCRQIDTGFDKCQSFEIEPFELDIGTYKIKLTVNSAVKMNYGKDISLFDHSGFGLYFIEIKESPLIAIIEGGESRAVSKNDWPVIIDGSNSNDPNQPPHQQSHLQWSWDCSDGSKCCKDRSSSKCKVEENLQENQEYKFTLTLRTKNGLQSKASQKVTVTNKPQIKLEIRCMKNCGLNGYPTNPREVVYLKVIVDKAKDSTKKMTFSWKYSCASKSAMESTDEIKQKNIDSSVLIVKEDKLTFGAECKFTVELDPKSIGQEAEGKSSIIILVNKPPGIGVCQVNQDEPACQPNECFKTKAKFIISCKNFIAHVPDVPLIYAFYQNGGQKSSGTLLGFSMSGELNNVPLTESTVKIRVYDKFGMYVESNSEVPVKLNDWIPDKEEIKNMLDNLHTLVLSRDSSRSAMAAGGIVDLTTNEAGKLDILDKVLYCLSKNYINDFSDVKLYSSGLRNILNKGVKKLEAGVTIGSSTIESMGALMEKLSSQLLIDSCNNKLMSPTITDSDIYDIAQTMVESADVIVSNEDYKALDVEDGTLKVFARTNQYKRGTASMIKGLTLSGMAVLNTLLPSQQEVVINAIVGPNQEVGTRMWLKVESPEVLANMIGIPQDSNTRIKMSKKFGKKIQEISKNVALQVITFKSNPYWWDLEDRDVTSDTISVQICKDPERGLRDIGSQLITEVSEDLDLYFKFKTTRSETVNGRATMPSKSASKDEKDEAVEVHTLEAPPESSNGKFFVEFNNLENIVLQVLLKENIRPDFEMMEKESETVTAQSASLSLSYNNIKKDTLHFIGILPGKKESPGETVKYSFNIYSIQCKMRLLTVWTSPACTVGEETTKELVHCKCSHLSFFGSSIFVAPHIVHPIKDIKLFLTVTNNPLVFTLILIILFVYLLLLAWAILKDKRNKLKREVIVLEDNFPGETYVYLVVVYTSFYYGSGTNANVGITIFGSKQHSRRHILRSQQYKCFKRNSDDWFLILTPKSLGDLEGVYLWHDNNGYHPDWYCKKVVIYDILEGKEYIFIIEQWLSVCPGEFPEAFAFAGCPKNIYQWKRVIAHNIFYNLRERHLWLSIFLSHPRATVTISQRLTIGFCVIMMTLLAGIMFYGIARGETLSDEPRYKLKLRVFIVAVQSAVLTTFVMAPIVISFRRSQIIKYQQQKSETDKDSLQSLKDSLQGLKDLTTTVGRRAFLKKMILKMLRGKPLIPILVGKESAESLIQRRLWAWFGWIMSQIVIWGGAFLIILYGLKLGKVTSELWITSASICLVSKALFNSPVKIITISTVMSMFGEITNITSYEFEDVHTINRKLSRNSKYLESLIKLRSSDIYKTLRQEKIAEYRKAALKRSKLVDRIKFIGSILLFLILMNVSGDLWGLKPYCVTSHIKLRLSKSKGVLHVPLDEVTNIKRLTDYLVSKLFYGLHKSEWYNKKVKLTSPEESSAEMGWFADSVHRMVGIPRMRQLRVKADNCSWAGLFNYTYVVCDYGTEDTNNYVLHWGKFSKVINVPLLAPWTYQQPEGENSYVYGASGIPYHSGGYIVDLFETQGKNNMMTSDLIDLNWWDMRMRAFIIELTLYNPNIDMYSLVSVIIEHLPTGAFTNRIHVTSVQIKANWIWTILYLAILLFFNINLYIFINRHGILSMLSSFWGCYDVLFVGLSNVAMILQVFKTIQAALAVHIFQEAGSSGFFFFSKTVWHHKLSLSVWSIVLCLAPIRLVKFKPFVSTCKTSCYTLYKARKILIAVSVLIISFTLLQIFVINFKILPDNLPFAVNTKYYRPNKRQPFTSYSGYYQVITSLLLAMITNTSLLILQMILINVYKVVRICFVP